MAEEKPPQVTVNFAHERDLFVALENMVADDLTDRSKFIKRLIRDERERRRELAKAARRATQGKTVRTTLQDNQGG